ncbi:MAG: hypothetical protein K2L35_03940 [Muribaculaceae bacterium]|nr:hypothetical protein [Muribaculaceae bacterium]
MMKQFFPAALCLLTAASSLAGTVQLSADQLMARTPAAPKAAPVMANAGTADRPVMRKASATTKSFDFTYAFEPYTAMNLGANVVGGEIYQAFEFTEEYASLYAGCDITAINMINGVNDSSEKNEITDVTLYIMESVKGGVIYSQKAKVSEEAFAKESVKLDTPYTIEAGKSFVVAYSFVPKSAQDYYLVVDGMANNRPTPSYIGMKDGSEYSWILVNPQAGNACIGVTIESDKLPADGMDIYTAMAPDFVTPGDPFEATIYLYNTAYNDVETLEVEYIVGDAEPQTAEWSFAEPLPAMVLAGGELKDVVCNQTGPSIPLKLRISKVNGQPNIGLYPDYYTEFTCLRKEDGYDRIILAEEGTGTWCGYCPAGIVFMEHLRNKYPEEVIRVAIHAGQSSPEPMQASSASALIEMFSGFPQIVFNRTTQFSPTMQNPNEAFAEYIETERRKAAVAEVSDLKVEFLAANHISMTAKSRFAIDVKNDLRYGVSFLITEDNVGPYKQTNYYAGGGNGEMGGWEKKGRSVSTIYDDVLRVCIGGRDGYTDVFPAEIKSGTEYECTDDVKIDNVTDSHFFVTALITDNVTGAVLNSRQVEVINSGVKTVGADNSNVKVAGGQGVINITGEYEMASVCDFGGVKVAEAAGASEIVLPAGLYIVMIDGASYKVNVK